MSKLSIDSISTLLCGNNDQLDSESLLPFKEIMIQLKNTYQKLLDNSKSMNLGLSLFNCKHQIFSEYLLNIVFSILFNASSSSQDDLLKIEISRALYKNKTLIEKSKSIETRMRYQMERLLNLSVNNSHSNSVDELLLSHKPNLSSILESSGEESSSSETESGIYKAPKISPAFFHTSQAEIDQKRKNAQKLSIKSRKLVQEFKEEFSNKPEEINTNLYQYPDNDEAKKGEFGVTSYEEENFTRIERKKKSSKSSTPKLIDALDELDGFGLLDKYTPNSEDDVGISSYFKGKKYSNKPSKKTLDEEIESDDDFSVSSSYKAKRKFK